MSIKFKEKKTQGSVKAYYLDCKEKIKNKITI